MTLTRWRTITEGVTALVVVTLPLRPASSQTNGMGTSSGLPPGIDIADIIEPTYRVSNWPATPAWYALFVTLLIGLAGIAWVIARRRNRTKTQRAALKELKAICITYEKHPNTAVFLRDVATLLRRVCLTRFERADVAGLTGKDWLAFLDKTGATNEFSQGIGTVLESERYQPQPTINPANTAELTRIIRHWVKQQR